MKLAEGNKKRLYQTILIILIALFFCSSANLIKADAKTIIAGERKTVFDYYDKRQESVSFTTSSPLIFCMPIKIKMDSSLSEGGIRIQLHNDQGRLLQNDYISYKSFEDNDYDSWFYSDGFIMPPGNYTYTLICTTDNDGNLPVVWSIIGYPKLAESIKFLKGSYVKAGVWTQIGTIKDTNNCLPYIKQVKSSNNKILPKNNYGCLLNGKIYVCGIRPGKVTITFKLANNKTFKKTLNVTPPTTNFQAELMSYNTRNNYITIKFKNKGVGSLKIFSSAKLNSYSYKTFDRSLSLVGGTTTIKPNSTKTLKFRINGSTTWYDIEDYWVDYSFKYYDTTYQARAYCDRDLSREKIGKKWYNTYWDSWYD